MGSIFECRGGWRAQAFDASRRRLARNFRTQADAKNWAADIEAAKMQAHAPELGGPTQVNLAQMLARYAELYTVKKRGAVQELNRIGHHLAAAGLPILRLRKDGTGKTALIECQPQALDGRVSKEWHIYPEARREVSGRTYQCIAKLACKRVSDIKRTDIDELVATMAQDELSASTVQKEVALLK